MGRPRGVHGEIFVTPETDFPERFENMKDILVKSNNGWEKFTVQWSKMISNRPVIKFESFRTPEDVGRLTNRQLGVHKDELVTLPQDTYFLFDLVGCRVYDEKTGESIGSIVDVECYPGNDVYVIELEQGRQVRIPAVKEFIKDVAVAEKRVVLDATMLFDAEN